MAVTNLRKADRQVRDLIQDNRHKSIQFSRPPRRGSLPIAYGIEILCSQFTARCRRLLLNRSRVAVRRSRRRLLPPVLAQQIQDRCCVPDLAAGWEEAFLDQPIRDPAQAATILA